MAISQAHRPKQIQALTLLLVVLPGCFAAGKTAQVPPEAKAAQRTAAESSALGLLWREPLDIASKDMLSGPGGRAHAPTSTTFTFVKEDLDGTSPKFVVR